MALGIMTAGGGQPWETAVVAELGHVGASMTVVRRCADVADLVATASTGQVSIALISAYLRHLDSEVVDRLRQCGVVVVAVHRAEDKRIAALLERIGVVDTLPDSSTADALVAAVGRAAAVGQASTGSGVEADATEVESRPSAAEMTAEPAPADAPSAGALPPAVDVPTQTRRFVPELSTGPDRTGAPTSEASTVPEPAREPMSRSRRDVDRGKEPRGRRRGRGRVGEGRADGNSGGRTGGRSGKRRSITVEDVSAQVRRLGSGLGPGRVVAIWGPGGAPGRSTVAMGLADRICAGGRSVMLVDADAYGGVLASAFGLMDESAGLAGACRLASTGRLEPESLTELCWRVGDRLTLLTGISRADRWPELRPSTIRTVLSCAAALVDVVVVDCAAILETDEEITFDTLAPRRNGATIAAIEAADTVLAVASADPAGMERLARGYVEVSGMVDSEQVPIVFNRVRSTAATRDELREAARRFCGAEPIAYLPEDRAATDLAWRQGVALCAAAPKSPLVAAMASLAEAVATRVPAHRRHAGSSSVAVSGKLP